MENSKEIMELKSQISEMKIEIGELRQIINGTNKWIGALKDGTLNLATEVSHAHEKINTLLYKEPEIVKTIEQIEEILGRADQPTPGAPPHS